MVVLQNQQLTRGGSSSTMTTGQATNPASIALCAIRSVGSEGNGVKGTVPLAAKISMMNNKKKIAADLQSALSGQSPLSIDLYVEVLADYEDELKASLDKDADDALLCMLADEGDVAMMIIDWDGSIYRNENALKKLQAMWRHSFEINVRTLVPILSDHISQKNLGVAGIKWLPASTG
jgi:hypothetical protein